MALFNLHETYFSSLVSQNLCSKYIHSPKLKFTLYMMMVLADFFSC